MAGLAQYWKGRFAVQSGKGAAGEISAVLDCKTLAHLGLVALSMGLYFFIWLISCTG